MFFFPSLPCPQYAPTFVWSEIATSFQNYLNHEDASDLCSGMAPFALLCCLSIPHLDTHIFFTFFLVKLYRTRVFFKRWALDFLRVRSRTDPTRTATRACARRVLRSPTRVALRCMVWSASAPTSCRCMHGVLWCGRPDQGHLLPSITSPAAWTFACITISSWLHLFGPYFTISVGVVNFVFNLCKLIVHKQEW